MPSLDEEKTKPGEKTSAQNKRKKYKNSEMIVNSLAFGRRIGLDFDDNVNNSQPI